MFSLLKAHMNIIDLVNNYLTRAPYGVLRFRNLVSIDFWRSSTLHSESLEILAENCPNLEVIDIGWW